MRMIEPVRVQLLLDSLKERELYVHLEITNGAYTSHHDKSRLVAANFIKNVPIRYTHGSISGSGPYRVGLKLERGGWVFAEGLTHYDEHETDRIVLEGHEQDGKLVVALLLGPEPF
ncbi:DUF1806 family protein [Paenibacillus protaetiae]|uniref:DUF1806 family protein n=1 Tax=Paenibacillus protaetiae TaxID=2509456 RepID=A0A4P6EWW2_9BACL|nr:DUF1806 family protein [Paenibacillus protaetiae]QAY67226.1 DUF1806 family protein [Paenibacillus protaetiae]